MKPPTLYYLKDDITGRVYDIDTRSGGYPCVTFLVPYSGISKKRIEDMLRAYKRMKLLPDSVTVHKVTL